MPYKQSKPKSAKGQALVEYTLYGGLTASVLAGALVVFSGSFNGLFTQIAKQFSGNANPSVTASQQTQNIANAMTAEAAKQEQQSINELLAQTNNTLNNAESLTEVSGGLGELVATNNITYSDTFASLAKKLEATDPGIALELKNLAIAGYILANRQYKTAMNDITPWQATDKSALNKALALDYVFADTIIVAPEVMKFKDPNTKNFVSVENLAATLPYTTQRFSEQYQKTESLLANSALSASDKALVVKLGTEIIDKAPLVTLQTSQTTEGNSDMIATCATMVCAP